MAAITANGMYGDRRRSFVRMAAPRRNGSATSSICRVSWRKPQFYRSDGGYPLSTNKDIVKLLNKQVQLLYCAHP